MRNNEFFDLQGSLIKSDGNFDEKYESLMMSVFDSMINLLKYLNSSKLMNHLTNEQHIFRELY